MGEGDAVTTTVINFSSKSFAGRTPQLEWGKWVKEPSFPIGSQSTQTFKCSGVCMRKFLSISLAN